MSLPELVGFPFALASFQIDSATNFALVIGSYREPVVETSFAEYYLGMPPVVTCVPVCSGSQGFLCYCR